MTTTDNLPSLLPCPFCGGDLEITKHFREEMWSGLHRCPVVGPIQFDWGDEERIFAAWNRRASPAPAPVAETIAAAEAASRQGRDALAAWWSAATREERLCIIDGARHLLSVLAPAPVGTAGWRLVPEDATDAMVAAALKCDWTDEDERSTAHNVWHAMSCAAPPAPGAAPVSAPVAAQPSLDVTERAKAIAWALYDTPVEEFGFQNAEALWGFLSEKSRTRYLAAARAVPAPAEAAVVESIRQAVADYHYALDTRQHGGVSADIALETIRQALNMPWVQGAEKALRAVGQAQGEG